MNLALLLSAVAAASAVMLAVRVICPPRRSLVGRLQPYGALARSRLGTGYADASVVTLTRADEGSALRGVFGPVVSQIASSLGNLVDSADVATIERRLRQAGLGSLRAEDYRMRQLGHAVGGVALGSFLGLALMGTASGTLLLIVAFGFPAATLQRNRTEKAIEERRGRMRSEVPTLAQLIAVHLRTGHGPVDAVRAVAALGRGPAVEELRDGLAWISGGTTPQQAYEKLAEATAEPAAARLYRVLASSARSGGDIGQPLLAIADDLRAQRREELARSAVRRRTAMLAPLLLLIAPVMALFVGAALPSLVLG